MPHPERGERRPDDRTFLSAYDRAWQRSQREPTPHNLGVLHAGEEILYRELLTPGKFALGRTLTTIGAHNAMAEALHLPAEFPLRHKHGDRGELEEKDRIENERALRDGGQLFSAYSTRRQATLWVITEWDHNATTMLLPDEH